MKNNNTARAYDYEEHIGQGTLMDKIHRRNEERRAEELRKEQERQALRKKELMESIGLAIFIPLLALGGIALYIYVWSTIPPSMW